MSKTSLESIVDPFCMSTDPKVIPYEEVQKAHLEIASGVVHTPLVKSHLQEIVGMNIYLKLETMQRTGSFKERGARYALSKLSDEEKKTGAITASLGNHSQGMTYHGMKLGIPVTVVMPVVAPTIKVQKCRNFKGNVILQGNNMSEAKDIARKMGKETGMTFINGYDHPDVIAGQGTVGIEILEDLSSIDAVIVPCGGGGLIAGIAAAIKTLSPATEVIGVESVNVPGFSTAIKNGKPKTTEFKSSIADGLAVPKVGYNATATAIHYGVAKIVTVTEEILSVAILHMLESEKLITEGAGASPLAAILSGQLDYLKGKKVVFVISGGNIDTGMLTRVIDRGLSTLGRFIKTFVYIPDKPGSMGQLASIIGSMGITLKHIHMERSWISDDDFSCKVLIMCEVSNINEALKLREILLKNYKRVEFPEFPNVCNARTLSLMF